MDAVTESASVLGAKRKATNSLPDSDPIKRPANTEICLRCNTVPWRDLSRRKIKESGELVTRVKETHRELLESRCPVCHCLAAIKPPELDGITCHLRAFSASGVWNRAMRVAPRDSTVVSVSESKVLVHQVHARGFLGLVDKKATLAPDIGPREIYPDSIDFSIVKEWLAHCESAHSKYPGRCKHKVATAVSGMKVVDCKTRTLVPIPSPCDYVALSYVWGASNGQADGKFDASQLPKAVADSITVTMALGFRYLWVDRYCIDQMSDTKHLQISQMDKIYSGAKLTIVVAAGDNANYGLPGVGIRARHQQAKVSIPSQGISLLQIFPHTATKLAESVWASRGWTFQEGYLSRRRLIFTDHQVSFLCNSMYAAESIQKSAAMHNAHSITEFRNIIPSVTSRLWTFPGLISEYTVRRLSFGSDAIDAVSGILKTFEDEEISHFWGVPFWKKNRFPIDWYHTDPTVTHARRTEFPSWSWAGWEGQIMFHWEDNYKLQWNVYVKNASQELEPLISTKSGFQLPGPKHIYISAPLINLSFRNITWAEKRGYQATRVRWPTALYGRQGRYKISRSDGLHVELPVSPHLTALAFVYMDGLHGQLDGLRGLALQKIKRYHGPFAQGRTGGTYFYSIIIVKQVSNEIYERVGVASVRAFQSRDALGPDYNHPMAFVDETGKLLDDVEIACNANEHDWIREVEPQLIKLQ